MKNILLVLLLLVPFQALADRDYDNGTYWTVTSVDTHPGMYDAYLSELKQVWRKSIEMLKADGKVLRYRMFSNVCRDSRYTRSALIRRGCQPTERTYRAMFV